MYYQSLKMVKLDETILDKKFSDLSSNYQNKVILASKLHDKEIVLVNFSRGLLKKEISYFKSLFRKVVSYNRRIILIDKNAEYKIGDHIIHTQFGEGVIVGIDKSILTIAFAHPHGIRKLLKGHKSIQRKGV